jgi:hypothetical protein
MRNIAEFTLIGRVGTIKQVGKTVGSPVQHSPGEHASLRTIVRELNRIADQSTDHFHTSGTLPARLRT